MTTTSDTERKRVEDEAALWLLQLSEAPNDAALRERFEDWHDRAALHAEVWERTSRAYALIGRAPPRHRAHWQSRTEAFEDDRRLPSAAFDDPVPVRPSHRRASGPLAAGLALMLVLIVALFPNPWPQWRGDLVTGTAEIRVVKLDDGSTVHLAPRSAMQVRFAADQRHVALTRGSAFFDVIPDPALPFVVTAGDTKTTVVGTAFEVRRDAAGERVSVEHGRVNVAVDGNARTRVRPLVAGQWLTIGPAGEVRRGVSPPDEIAAWRQGELIVRNGRVTDIVATLGQYHRGAILVFDDELTARRVSGVYSLEDPAATLRDLAASHGAQVQSLTPWLLIISKR